LIEQALVKDTTEGLVRHQVGALPISFLTKVHIRRRLA